MKQNDNNNKKGKSNIFRNSCSVLPDTHCMCMEVRLKMKRLPNKQKNKGHAKEQSNTFSYSVFEMYIITIRRKRQKASHMRLFSLDNNNERLLLGMG